jgi:hypothetical protein
VRGSLLKKLGPAVVAGALLLSGIITPASAQTTDAVASPHAPLIPTTTTDVVAFALRADGVELRHDGPVTVDRVDIPASIRDGGPASLYRVRVAGRFPPRALRYDVLAGGRFIGFGVPGRVGSVRALTTDPRVLTEAISVMYGGRPVRGVPSPVGAAIEKAGHASSSAAPSGPLSVTKAVYDFGDQATQLTGITGKVELTADVHYPTGLPGGPYPLVLFLHGNHNSCFSGGSATFQWPCPGGSSPIPSYTGYDYVASDLASFGFIVVSISGNGVNVLGSDQISDTGMRQRGELIEQHIDLWKTWSTTGGGPFTNPDAFVGKVDLTRIGTMGHSRGGEGAVWNVIVDRERADPYGIDAVLPLAPVDFDRETVNDVPLAVVLPYCDGDVSDLQGIHFFDDARYREPGDPTPKHTVTIYGANHNFFNTVWSPGGGYPGAFDDGDSRCPGRLTQAQQRNAGETFIVSFFRRYLAGTLGQDPIWTGRKTAPIDPARALVSYLAPDDPDLRMDVDRFKKASSLSTDQPGGKVVVQHLVTADWCAETFGDPCVKGTHESADVHLPGNPQGILGWSHGRGSIRFGLPAGSRNVSGFDALQFRGAVNPQYRVNRGIAKQDLVVRLVDGGGHHASVSASDVGNAALRYPEGLSTGLGHMILNQVRFPLSRFRGVDLHHLRSVTLSFTRTTEGAIDVADLAFCSGGA